jgi:hypothetical protein
MVAAAASPTSSARADDDNVITCTGSLTYLDLAIPLAIIVDETEGHSCLLERTQAGPAKANWQATDKIPVRTPRVIHTGLESPAGDNDTLYCELVTVEVALEPRSCCRPRTTCSIAVGGMMAN